MHSIKFLAPRLAGIGLLLLCANCSGHSGQTPPLSPTPPAIPVFTDVASTAQLLFTGKVGPTYYDNSSDSPNFRAIMQRNMGTGAAVGDYDDDGDLDVYLLGYLGHPNRLFRNNLDLGSKTFTEDTPPELVV